MNTSSRIRRVVTLVVVIGAVAAVLFWGPSRGTPPHGSFAPIRTAVLAQDFGRLPDVTAPFRARGGTRDWARTADLAHKLSRARLRSEVRAVYGHLLTSCGECHAGEQDALPLGTTHGAGLAALDRALMHRDPAAAARALDPIQKSPSLGDSQLRIRSVTQKLAESTEPAVYAKFSGLLLDSCWTCHGVRPGL